MAWALVVAAGTASADITRATHAAGPYEPGRTLQVSVAIEHTGDLSALGVQVTLPGGWRYGSASGGKAPTITPSSGATGTLEFAWIKTPSSPVQFSYTVSVPAGETGSRELRAVALGRSTGPEFRSTVQPNPLVVAGPSLRPATAPDSRTTAPENRPVVHSAPLQVAESVAPPTVQPPVPSTPQPPVQPAPLPEPRSPLPQAVPAAPTADSRPAAPAASAPIPALPAAPAPTPPPTTETRSTGQPASPGTASPDQGGSVSPAGAPGLAPEPAAAPGAAAPGAAPLKPQLVVSPRSKEFGSGSAGPSSQVSAQDRTERLLIANGGGGSLQVTGVTVSDVGNFSLDLRGGPDPCGSPPFTLGPDQSCTVTVAVRPGAAARAAAEVTVTSPDSAPAKVSLTIGRQGADERGLWEKLGCFVGRLGW